jgi:hypothetical protein
VSWSGLERAIALVADGTMPTVAVSELLRQELRAVRQAVAECARAIWSAPGGARRRSSQSNRLALTESELPDDATVEEVHQRLDYLTRERDAALARVRELSRELAHLGRAPTGQARSDAPPLTSAASPTAPAIPAAARSEPSVGASESSSSRFPLPSLRPRPPLSAGTYSVGPGKIAEEEVFVAPPSRPATSRP